MAEKYFIGTFQKAPFQNLTVGGLCFPKITCDAVPNPEGNAMVQNQKTGDVIDLSPEEVAQIEKAAFNKIIRWNSNQTRATLISRDNKYQPFPNDEPVANHIYMISVAQASKWDPMWREKEPVHSLAVIIRERERRATMVIAAEQPPAPKPAEKPEGKKKEETARKTEKKQKARR